MHSYYSLSARGIPKLFKISLGISLKLIAMTNGYGLAMRAFAKWLVHRMYWEHRRDSRNSRGLRFSLLDRQIKNVAKTTNYVFEIHNWHSPHDNRNNHKKKKNLKKCTEAKLVHTFSKCGSFHGSSSLQKTYL